MEQKPLQMVEPETKYRQPELCLVAEILSQAIADLGANDDDLRKRARDWLRYDSDEPFTARWCCTQLGLHVGILRHALRMPEITQRKILIYRKLYGKRRGFTGFLPKGTKLRVA